MKFPQVPNLLTLIFRNYPATKPVTARDVADKILPDLERIASKQNAAESPSGVTAGTYGNESSVGRFTVDEFGEITAANNVSIQITESQVTNLVSDLAAMNSNSIAYSIALGGVI